MTKNVRKVLDGFIATAADALARGDRDNAAHALTMAARYLDMQARMSGKPADIAAARAMWTQAASV